MLYNYITGNSYKGLLRYEDKCLSLSKTWISDNGTIFVDITNALYISNYYVNSGLGRTLQWW